MQRRSLPPITPPIEAEKQRNDVFNVSDIDGIRIMHDRILEQERNHTSMIKSMAALQAGIQESINRTETYFKVDATNQRQLEQNLMGLGSFYMQISSQVQALVKQAELQKQIIESGFEISRKKEKLLNDLIEQLDQKHTQETQQIMGVVDSLTERINEKMSASISEVEKRVGERLAAVTNGFHFEHDQLLSKVNSLEQRISSEFENVRNEVKEAKEAIWREQTGQSMEQSELSSTIKQQLDSVNAKIETSYGYQAHLDKKLSLIEHRLSQETSELATSIGNITGSLQLLKDTVIMIKNDSSLHEVIQTELDDLKMTFGNELARTKELLRKEFKYYDRQLFVI